MVVNSAVPRALVGSVVAYFRLRQVILCGSAAHGEANVDSDIDLLAVVVYERR